MLRTILLLITVAFVSACGINATQDKKDQHAVAAQQSQYAASQPVPVYNWSIERDMVISLYNIRNTKAVTHSVWRSDYGTIEGDCPSLGFGIPYDTSLTNPLTATDFARSGYDRHVVEQPEPNGIFASKNTAATWVACVNEMGLIEPVYVEAKVTAYPYPIEVNYATNRAMKVGSATVTIDPGNAQTIE